jgi:hypothetical protein
MLIHFFIMAGTTITQPYGIVPGDRENDGCKLGA